MKALFDTNILIDYLNGIEAAKAEIEQFDRRLISVITRMEVLVGCDLENESIVRGFLDTFDCVSIDEPISELAVDIRRKNRLKLPDAIIWASAKANDALLVTRNTKDFPEEAADFRVPYTV